MAVTIRVTPERLNQSAKVIDSVNTNIKTCFQEHSAVVNHIVTNWKGEASQKHINMYNNALNTFNSVLQGFGIDQLKTLDMSVNYADSEDYNTQVGQALDKNFL